MDPKKIPPNLDPKLKEVYERVMGTPAGGTNPQPASQPPLPPQTQPSWAPPLPPRPSPITPPPPPQTSAPQESRPFPKQETAVSVPQKKSHLTTVIFAIVGLVFFAVYALFWMRFFNLPVPFLPQ